MAKKADLTSEILRDDRIGSDAKLILAAFRGEASLDETKSLTEGQIAGAVGLSKSPGGVRVALIALAKHIPRFTLDQSEVAGAGILRQLTAA